MTLTMPQTTLSPKGKLVAGASVLLLVAACGGGSGAVNGINTLGAAFVQAFQTDPNGSVLENVEGAGLTVNPNIDPFNP
jgi:hypothetical protein